MDRAGWHSTGKLKVPKNLTIILLPSRSPELNPVENIWQYLRQNWLSNRVFEDYHAIIEAGCQAWNKLIDQPETIMSIIADHPLHIAFVVTLAGTAVAVLEEVMELQPAERPRSLPRAI